MPAARAYFRVGSGPMSGVRVDSVRAVMVMSGSCGRGVGGAGWWRRLRSGPDDRVERQSQVAQLLEQAVQGALVGDVAGEHGDAVVGGQRHAVEEGAPAWLEAALEADRVPAALVRAAGRCGVHAPKVGAGPVTAPHILW